MLILISPLSIELVKSNNFLAMKKGFNLTVNSVLKAVKRMKYCLPNSGWTEANRQTDIKCFNFLRLQICTEKFKLNT